MSPFILIAKFLLSMLAARFYEFFDSEASMQHEAKGPGQEREASWSEARKPKSASIETS
jgi:hypothetical protein